MAQRLDRLEAERRRMMLARIARVDGHRDEEEELIDVRFVPLLGAEGL